MDVDELLRETGDDWRPPTPPALDVAGAVSRSTGRLRAAVAVWTAAAVVVGGGTALAAWPRAVPAVPATPTPAGTTTLGQATPPSPGLPTSTSADTIAWLTERARTTATAQGRGTTPVTAEAVATSAALAEDVLHSGENPPAADHDVWVVQLRGQFECGTCSRPMGADSPAGTVIQLVLPASGAVEGGSFTLTRSAADLTRLGDVIPLDLGVLELSPFDDPDQATTALADTVRRQLAGIDHDDPVTGEAGRTTLGRAQQLIVGHTPYPPSDTKVWFVQLQGQFSCGDCTRVGGIATRKANVLTLVLDPATGERLMAAVSDERFDLTEFGYLFYLEPRELSTAPEWQPALATWPAPTPAGPGPAAALDGVLRLTGGCLVVESDAGPVYLPVLPTPGAGWSAIEQALTFDGVTVRVGDRVSWGGGYSVDPAADWSVPDSCRGMGQEYFRVNAG
jgi:hypothetical protein